MAALTGALPAVRPHIALPGALDQGVEAQWSLILKVLHPPVHRGHPSDLDYWRREADACKPGCWMICPAALRRPDALASPIGSMASVGSGWRMSG